MGGETPGKHEEVAKRHRSPDRYRGREGQNERSRGYARDLSKDDHEIEEQGAQGEELRRDGQCLGEIG